MVGLCGVSHIDRLACTERSLKNTVPEITMQLLMPTDWRFCSRRSLILALLLLEGCAHVAAPAHRVLSRPLELADGRVLDAVHESQASAQGCRLYSVRFEPPGFPDQTLVVLAHGFLREPDTLAGLARALAASGLRVLVPRLCPWRAGSSAHWRNGMALIELADRLKARRVIYVGFSVGALSALIAARHDPRAVGLVTLDAVEADALSAPHVADLRVPVLALWGEPSRCNAWQRARPILARAPCIESRTFAATSHCAFESPSDWRCRLLCESGATDWANPRAAITAQVRDWVLARAAQSDPAASRASGRPMCVW